MPGTCPQCRSPTFLGRTTVSTELLEIRNVPCRICPECGYEEIGFQVQRKIDKLLQRAAQGKVRDRVVVL
jgi:YgiT-type zinc finger domain-containing protein